MLRHTFAKVKLFSQHGITTSRAANISRAMSTFDRDDIMKYLSKPPYTLPSQKKVVAPPMVYIAGEEMTHYTMNLM